MEIENIAVIGLGYVGLPLAVEFGKVKPTVGLDINELRTDQLKNGFDSTSEVSKEGLQSAIHLSLTSNWDDISKCKFFIVTVPTPIDKANRPDLAPLVAASKSIAGVLKPGDIVIYESTVFPGCTEEICVPVLEAGSGLSFNKDFFCGYSPERINPGDKINTLTTIKKLTVDLLLLWLM